MSEHEREEREERESEHEREGEREERRSLADQLGLNDDQARAFEELRRENANRRRSERAAQSVNDELREELERLRTQHESDSEKTVREAVDEARAEVASNYERRLLEAQVARQAAGTLRDPEDAVRLLPMDELLGIADERERAKRVDDALSELVESKPYLANANGETASSGGRSTLVTQGGRSERPGGSRSEGTSPDDWIRKRARR
jgi:hypothetical protein